MSFLPLEMLKEGALEIGVGLSDSQLELYDSFASLLVETNKYFNLTRITEPEEIVRNHYLDSLLCLSACEHANGAKTIDIGTGAGFPGIPIKIARPDLDMTLIDSTSKKIRFIKDAVSKLDFTNTYPMHARAEELGHQKDHREAYDIAYARALSEMKVLAELSLPLVKIGGRVVAQKSIDIIEELKLALPLIGQLGGSVEKTCRLKIPFTDIERVIVVIKKDKPTPQQFPRPYAKIVKGKQIASQR